jgi:RimJ/RimL family protein N-acetyltransferase
VTTTDLPVGDPVPPIAVAPPARVPLTGRFVTLEPLDPARHAHGLFAAGHGSPEADALWTYLPYGPFPDEAAMRDWLQTLADSRDPLFFAVVWGANGAPVGMASYLNVDPAMRRLEVGHIWYGPAAQRTEANTEACLLLLAAAFDGGYRRVEWKCDVLNARSRAAASRLGFTFEGVFRRHMIVKGRNRDTAWFSVTDAEWAAVRARSTEWLDAPADTREALGTP